ncbi:MAG: sulfotransferase [Deltaproteobacteria bacterium]|nr:sulfotransferase [Deltaproteobacteria bacterium]
MSAISQFIPRSVLRRLLARYPVSESARERARSRLIFATLTSPLRWAENLRWNRKIRQTEVKAPVFLLGFGRSGTTHLHYLFWQDPQFGVVSNYQASMQPVALIGNGWLPRLIGRSMPSTRPIDNVAISLDTPQEEEIAMVNSSEHAPLHFMTFPNELPELYDRYVCRLGSDAAVLDAWKQDYLRVLKKATILSEGRRLALKTPTNTARVRVLSEMFPDAKFVNIVRNPYRVYRSMRNMYRTVLPDQALQEFDWDEIDRWTLDAYSSMMSKYLDERKLLGDDRLVEIRYEDLVEHPIEELQKIYAALELGEFDRVRPIFEAYLATIADYETNEFDFPDEIVAAVNERWAFAFDAFGYERVEPGELPR